MSLREYESLKFELGDILRALAAQAPAQAGLEPAVGQLITRLAEDSFNLVVVGRFSRGKTSLMNAILGVDCLPTGILPLTSVITSVAYSSREEVKLQFEQGLFGYEIAMSELADNITERGNPGNVKRIARARIGLPVELLRRGFQFVDTPGLGSAIAENARTTESFLPEADALLMVSGYDAPLSDDELRVARQLAGLNRRLFFVLNKQDIVSEPERREVLDYVQRRLADALPERQPPVYSVSARDGLAAKIAGDRSQLVASGIAGLEEALTRFLIEDKAIEFLSSMCERVQGLMDGLAGLASKADIRPLQGRLRALREQIGQPGSAPALAMASPAEPITADLPRIEECLMCRRASQGVFEFLCRYQHELASSTDARERFAAAGGLCGPHVRLYASLASERDICLALAPLMQRIAQALGSAAQGGGAHASVSLESLQATRDDCAVCRLQRDTEDRVMALLAAQHSQASESSRTPLPSLCLPHLRSVSTRCGDNELVEALWHRQAAASERLSEDMRRYVLKRDGTRHGLASEEELQAAKRAVAFVAGR